MQDLKQKALNLFATGHNSHEVYRILEKEGYDLPAYETFRCRLKGWRSRRGVVVKPQTSVTMENEGRTYEDVYQIGEDVTPERVMRDKGLSPDDWEVVSFTTNLWQQHTKEGGTVNLIQSKLRVKPKGDIIDILKIIHDFYENHEIKALDCKNHENYAKNSLNSSETLLVDITDLHSGLMAWGKESGNDYNLDIMSERFRGCIDEIALRITPTRFQKIYIACLGDIFHIDNLNYSTTKGTPQTADHRIQKVIEQTLLDFEYMLMRLSKFAPIEFIHVSGNHDTLVGYMFALALKQAFKNYDNIVFDVDNAPFKARLVGKTLIGFTHGANKKARDGNWLVNDYREMFGKCAIAEVHEGHLHEQGVKEYTTGVIVRNLPKLCNASAWENAMGYRSYAAMFCFVYDDTKLHRETWINYC